MKKFQNQRGTAVVEFAILSALLVVIVFGIIEFGFLWLQSNYISNAAREGARIAAKKDNAADRTAAAQDAVKSVLGGLYSDVTDCCSSNDFIYVDVNENASVDANGTAVPGIRVVVEVQSDQIWEPVLWDLLTLLPGPDRAEIRSITQSATFATE